MKVITVYEARTEGFLPQSLQKFALSGVGISLIAGTILTIMAPYQTGGFPFLWRFIYWTSLCFVGGLGAAAFAPLAKKLGITASAVKTVFGQSLLATLIVCVCLVGLDLFRNGDASLLRFLALFGLVWVISIIISGIAHLAERAANPENTKSHSRPALYERLKPSLRQSEIYALTAEDHYVRVITSKGEDLILLRLSDAIKEISPLPGLMTHRSWWVAEAGVKSVKKSDGKLSLELHSGQTAPVSRSNAKTVKDAGWL